MEKITLSWQWERQSSAQLVSLMNLINTANQAVLLFRKSVKFGRMPMPKKFVAKKTPNLFVWNLNQIQFLIFFIFASVIAQPKCQTSFPRLEIQSQNNLLKALNPIKMARVVKGPVMMGLHHLGLVSRKSCI